MFGDCHRNCFKCLCLRDHQRHLIHHAIGIVIQSKFDNVRAYWDVYEMAVALLDQCDTRVPDFPSYREQRDGLSTV